MSPDDPRHGTNAGYVQHAFTDRDYCQPCREAHAEYRRNLWRRRYLRRVDALHIPSVGSRRRVQALLALGHTHGQIAAAAGATPNISKNVLAKRHPVIHVDTAAAIERAYEALCMVVPTGWRAEECRRRARQLGYLPPLAWDDIDDPDERPRTTRPRHIPKTDVDPIVVERVLAGERMKITRAERLEIVARSRALGWSEDEIEQRTGIAKATDKTRFGDHFPKCGCTPGSAASGWIETRGPACRFDVGELEVAS